MSTSTQPVSPSPSYSHPDALAHSTHTRSTSSSSLPFFPKSSSRNSAMNRIIPSNSFTTSTISEIEGSRDVPIRTSSLNRRKPVPAYLPMPNASLPSSHPFANSTVSNPTSRAGTPTSPTPGKVEDLFYSPPRGSGPLPPRRSPSGNVILRSGSPASDASGSRGDRSSMIGREERKKADLLREAQEKALRGEARTREMTSSSSGHSQTAAISHLGHSTSSENNHDEHSSSDKPERIVPADPSPRRLMKFDKGSPILDRPLPPVPDPSQPDLYSKVSLESLVGPATPPTPLRSLAQIRLFGGKGRPSTSHAQGSKRPSGPGHVSMVRSESQPISREAATPEPEEFSVDRIPTREIMLEASTCLLRDENGDLVSFGDFFPRYPTAEELDATKEDSPGYPPITKTVVFFIRHFWCGQCQDFTFASLALLDPEAIRRAGCRVVVISNGSWKIIKAYRRILNCPFPICVDGPRKLYQTLGMKLNRDFGPIKNRPAYHQSAVPGQLVRGIANGFFRFPLADPGKLNQQGGEFILAPGHKCDFAHRMTHNSDHMEAPDVLRLAGVNHPTTGEVKEFEIAEAQRAELEKLEQEMKQWRGEREAELARIRQRKAERRGQAYVPTRPTSGIGLGINEELDEYDPESSETLEDEALLQEQMDRKYTRRAMERKEIDLGDEGDDAEGAEFEVVGKPRYAGVDDSLRERFEEVMNGEENDERRRVEHDAAASRAKARGRGDLDVEVEDE